MRMLLEMGLSNAVVAAVLALPVAAISRLCRRPALTHSLWLVVLLKLVTPPLVPLPSDWLPSWESSLLPNEPVAAAQGPALPDAAVLSPPSTTDLEQGEETLPSLLPSKDSCAEGPPERIILNEEASPLRDANCGPDKSVPFAWKELLVYLWPIGSLAWFAWAGLHICRFQRLLRHARLGTAELQKQVESLCRRLGLRRCPQIWLVPGAVSPMVWTAGGRPRLLFPAKLLDRLDRDQRATLLTHELAHIRRRDHWVRALEVLVSGLYWWHPVVWWARREIHEAEEQCCDAWVVDTLEDASRSYALALLQTVAFFSKVRSALPLTASGIGQVPHLRRRLTMIMSGKTPRSLSWTGCLVVLGLAAMLLPLSAVQAQAQAQPREVDKSGAKDDREQQIEQLKKALRILEDLKRADKTEKPDTPAAKSVDPDEMRKAKESINDLQKQIEAKRSELRALEMKLKEAVKRIAEMDHAAATAKAGERIKVMIRSQEGQQPQEKREAALEEKLERILRDVEDLKKEIRRENSKPSPTKPGLGKSEAPPSVPGQLTAPTETTPPTLAPENSNSAPPAKSSAEPALAPRTSTPATAPTSPAPATPPDTAPRR